MQSFTWFGAPDRETTTKLFQEADRRGYLTLTDAGIIEHYDQDKGWQITSTQGIKGLAFNPETEYRFVFNPPLVNDPKMNPVESLSDVNKILDERGSRYGKFKDHADITQTLKQSADHFLKVKHNTDLKNKLSASQHEALDMIFHKIGRILNGDPNYSDSWWDLAGYAQLVAEELDGKGR